MTHFTSTSPTVAVIPGYVVAEQLYLGSRTAVYRAVQTATQTPVVIKVLRRDCPSFGELVQFRNQYTIAKNLPLPGIVQPLSLETVGNGYALVMADWGGVALTHYGQGQPLDWPGVLAIALQLADILHGLSQHRVIHKDIKPANILIHPQTQQVKLIDFSIASLLPQETQAIQDPNGLEGTLAYIAPEQTGRMNRGIDYRADFYALGVTLYELLTGVLPFTAKDPLELIHCHIAKVATPVDQVNPAVPGMVAAIVAKLMAKNAEDRYQSALGLKHDLQRCLNPGQDHGQEQGDIAPFGLGERDVSDRFLIPETLYGRSEAVATLLAAFERVTAGAGELMLVAGDSGVGKTAVVNEVHKPILRQRGHLIQGKFDQLNRNVPLSAFVQALRDLVTQILSASHTQADHWQAAILAALGKNAQVLIEVLPELEHVIGPQPPAPALVGSAAQSRFNRLMQEFIQVFATADHPLVLFLDGLQWADLASLQLLKRLLTNGNHLLIIGAYRSTEVSAIHPLTLAVNDLKKAEKTVHTITLQPLSLADTNHLIADTLHCSLELAAPLTQLINRKTQGNPFFTIQYLKALHEEGKIFFDHSHGHWICDLATINALTITDDVVALMAAQLQKLSPETQTALKLAACIGNEFDLATLALISQQEAQTVAIALWPALQEGLVLPTSDIYPFFQGDGDELPQGAEPLNLTYRFLHDRIQQAAYSLIPAPEQQRTRYRIGQILRANLNDEALTSQIFKLVSQLNSGIEHITDPTEKQDLAQLNLIAAYRSQSAAAHAATFAYCTTGIQLLAPDAWETDAAFTLELYELATTAAFLCGDNECLEAYAGAILSHTQDPLDQLKVNEIRIQAYTVQGHLSPALDLAKQALQTLGVTLPTAMTPAEIQQGLADIQQRLDRVTLAQVATLPPMTEPLPLGVMRLLQSITATAYIADPSLFPFIVFRMVEWSLTHGNAPASPFAYAAYGILRVSLAHDVATVAALGELALTLLAKSSDRELECRTKIVIASHLFHWKFHFKNSLPLLQESYQLALEVGDLEYAGYNAQITCFGRYLLGHELIGLEADIQAYCQELDQLNQVTTLRYCQIYQQAVLNFLGATQHPSELNGKAFNRPSSLPAMVAAGDGTGLFHVYCNQLILNYWFGNIPEARVAAAQAKTHESSLAGMFIIPVYYFYDSLAILKDPATSPDTPPWQQLLANLEQLETWATHAPDNHQHRLDLVRAEYYRATHQPYQAMEAYDRAIAGAKTHGYTQEEGLAHELAATFYLSRGKERIAAAYMQDAYYCYGRWGAKAKVDDLERRYPPLLASILQSPPPPTTPLEEVSQADFADTIHAPFARSSSASSSSDSFALDLPAILKASQALSSAIELNRLLATLLDIVLQNAGADKVALLMPQDQDWFIEAIAHLGEPTRIASVPLTETAEIALSLVYQAQCSQTPMVIMDATIHPTLATDPYIVQHQPKSLLCTPVLNQGKLVAMLYVENHLTAAAFTRDRIDLLNFLCAQAAISLENARLYQQSQQYNQQLEQSLQELNLTQSRFHNLVDNVPGVVYQLHQARDNSANMVYISNDCYDLYEIPAEEIVANANLMTEVVHPEDLDSFYQGMQTSIETLNPLQWEGRIVTRTGKVKWVRSEAKLTQLDSDTLIWDGLLLDISARKLAELQLQQQAEKTGESQQLLQLVFDTLPQRVFWKDRDSRFLGCNKLFLEDADLTDLREIIGKTDFDLCWRANAEEYLARDTEVLTSGQPRINFEEPLTKEDGTRMWLRTSKIPLRNAEGEIIGVFGSYEDITSLKATEELLRQQKQDLEAALTQLQQTQLQMVQSEKMASLGNLVAGVAHEVNNPIGFLNGSINNAKDYVQDLLGHLALYEQYHPQAATPVQDNAENIDLEFVRDDLPKLLNSMKGATDRIKSISTSLRTFSRADAEHKIRANLHEGMDSTLLILKYRLKANEHRPAIEVVRNYGDIPLVECFPSQLNQVFMNILANAIDAFDEVAQQCSFDHLKAHPQRIQIQTLLRADAGVEICIGDNGKGMPEEVKTRVFDHLFTTKAVGKGTGLGLAIAQQIVVEKHGGNLRVESVPGQGTQFYISLPVCAES